MTAFIPSLFQGLQRRSKFAKWEPKIKMCVCVFCCFFYLTSESFVPPPLHQIHLICLWPGSGSGLSWATEGQFFATLPPPPPPLPCGCISVPVLSPPLLQYIYILKATFNQSPKYVCNNPPPSRRWSAFLHPFPPQHSISHQFPWCLLQSVPGGRPSSVTKWLQVHLYFIQTI